MGQSNICNVKGVACSAEPTTEWSPGAAVPLSSTECFSLFQLIVLTQQPASVLIQALVNHVSSLNQAAVFIKKALVIHCTLYLPSTEEQTDKVSEAIRRVSIWLRFTKWKETQLQMSDNDAPCLLHVFK